MKKGWIQAGDSVYTIYTGKLTRHTVVGREGTDGYWVALDNKLMVSIGNIYSWKSLAKTVLLWYKLKSYMRGLL